MTQNQQSFLLNGENGVSFLMSRTDWTKPKEKRNLLHKLERKTLEKHSQHWKKQNKTYKCGLLIK